MKQKQFDHIENKIREAAENSEPDFDEQSWEKMERLLDKENDRKRPLGWILLPVFLCMLAGGFFIFKKNSKTNHSTENTTAENKNHLTSKENDVQPAVPFTNVPAQKDLSIKDADNGTTFAQTDSSQVVYLDHINQTASHPQTNDHHIYSNADDLNLHSSPKYRSASKSKTNIHITSPDAAEDVTEDKIANKNDQQKINTELTVTNNEEINKQTIPVAKESDIVKNEIEKEKKTDSAEKKNAITSQQPAPEKKKLSNQSKFYFLATAGAEVSSVKFLSANNSAVVAKYGIGAGYQLSKRLSVQTGFNVSRKKYIAGTGDYNPKAGSYWSMVEIKKVDANCLVYEIPLALRYNIAQIKSSVFYATAGVSSFIMKKEDYNYFYNHNNVAYEQKYSYTGNKNAFSIFTLSAGVEKKLNNGFSLLAEPSVSIPISGVGDGSVKLYSFGLQAGVKYQPFKRRK